MPAPTRVDVLVLGIGGMGAAALAHLTAPRRGLRVLGVEQDLVPSARGSSTGHTRVIRKAYFEDPRYVPLLLRAYELWRELERESGQALLQITGCLNLGPPDHVAIRGVMDSVTQHHLPHALLSSTEIQARFPALVPAREDIGIFEEDGGFLRAEACTSAHAELARRRGAELRTSTAVEAVEVDGRGVRATLAGGEVVEASRLVVSGGPWLTGPVLRELARDLPSLTVERQVQLWFSPSRPELARAPSLPAFIHFTGARAYYGIPMEAPEQDTGLGLKVCRHHGGEPTTPVDLDRTLRDADVADVRGYLKAHLPMADGPAVTSRVCMYTNTRDENFVVGLHPRWPHVVVLGGFSGHGYKMAAVMGEIAADLAQTGRCAFDLGMFDPRRRP